MLEDYGFEKIYPNDDGPTVVVGMSGGVDSSVSAYILRWQGYRVIGLFMKNWEERGEYCPAEADFSDVKRVCETIGIPYYSINFSNEYMDNVFKQFLDGLERGFTPNPDILCNREIKFGPFLQYADKIGAEFIATGHYCRGGTAAWSAGTESTRLVCGTRPSEKVDHLAVAQTVLDFASVLSVPADHAAAPKLLKGLDPNKDQSYFLCALTPKQLSRVIFPIGHLRKETVRQIAGKVGLVTASKKDSTGICFIGERRFRDFLKTYFGNRGGDIRTLDGTFVGKHIGLMYYTIGQRKGLGIGGKKSSRKENSTEQQQPGPASRWFVVRKDLKTNTLYVNNGECEELYSKTLAASRFNWIENPPSQETQTRCTAKTRYHQPDQPCTVQITDDGGVKVTFDAAQRAITPGQWVVLYDGDICLGGGQIEGD